MSTDAIEFTGDMAHLINALRVSLTLLTMVDNKRLEYLDKTISKADTLAFILVRPVDFPQANDNLAMQRRLLEWVRDTRQCLRDIINIKGKENIFTGWEGEDTPSIDWLLGEATSDE